MTIKKVSSDLMSVKGIGKKRHEKIMTVLKKTKKSIDSIFDMTAIDIKQTFGIPINVAKEIVTYRPSVEESPEAKFDLVEMSQDILEVSQSDTLYPKRLLQVLNDKAPKTLYMWGNLALLDKLAVGFCGSRDVSDKGLGVTADVSQQIVELGWVVVSGHARGVDMTAHRTALENDGGTIIVIPEGIDLFRLRRELKIIAKSKNILIISEFKRDAKWAVGRAMQRNKTIIALSNAMVLVESNMKGGTFNAGKEALKLNHPLYVVAFKAEGKQSEGNDYFIKKGAVTLLKNKYSNRANIESLKAVVNKQQLDNVEVQQDMIQMKLM